MSSSSSSVIDHSINADDIALERLSEISKLPGVRKVVGLTDLHQGDQETPTSIVTATEDVIYPELSSNVINCGMSLIKTGLREDEITDTFVSAFCTELNDRSAELKPDRKDVTNMLLSGAEYVTEHWDCDKSVLENIENNGNMFDEDNKPTKSTDIIPPWLLWYGGTYENLPIPSLSSNHFIEFQVIDEIIDEETANEWDLSEDQVVIFLHGDYTLTSMINWHHANRLKFREQIPITDQIKLQLSKVGFHLLRDGVIRFSGNWGVYNSKERYTKFETNTTQGKQIRQAIFAAMNFAYANRLLASHCIDESLRSLTSESISNELVWDVGHDTIQQEEIQGQEYWIHRKGAAKSVPGKPALVSGARNMNSFLGKCSPNGDSFLNSYDHGCSHVLDYYGNNVLQSTDDSTLMFDYPDAKFKNKIQHISSKPIDRVVQNLSENDIVSEVAWLRPTANLTE